MARALTIVGLGGSLARVSKSRAALELALEGASSAGAETTLLDLRELDLPMYNPDNEQPTDAAARLIDACYSADGMLWSSPMYQGTISVPSRTRSTGCTCSVLASRRSSTTR
jgi:FMN reductase